MRYWLYDPSTKKPAGPFGLEQLRALPGFGPETFAAPENTKEANPWKRARELPELAALFAPAPVPVPVPPPAAPPPAEAAIPPLAGFWRRVAALIVDSVVLGLFGQALGLLLYDRLCALGPWGRPLGFLIALAYFVPQTGVLCGGRTLGKRLLKIRVVDRRGRPLSMGKAGLREFVLLLPGFLNYALMPRGINAMWAGTIATVVIFVVWPSLIYLAAFNRRTHQGLHDLLAGSYVAGPDAEGSFERLPSVWAGHYAVLAVMLAAVSIGGYFAFRALSKMSGMTEMTAASNELQDSGRWIVRSINRGRTIRRNAMGHPFKGKLDTSFVNVLALSLQPIHDRDADLNDMARILFKAYPDAAAADNVVIQESYGFDIGIASRFNVRGANYTPADWQARLSSGTLAAVVPSTGTLTAAEVAVSPAAQSATAAPPPTEPPR